MSKYIDLFSKLNEYEYFDIHAHLNSNPLLQQADLIIDICKNEKILINNAGTELIDSLEAINQAKKYDNVFAMIGIHPMCIEETKSCEYYVHELEQLYIKNKEYILCLGEIGLELTSNQIAYEKQKKLLIMLFDLARKYSLPIEMHIRNANEDAIQIIKQYGQGLKILIHCFALGYDIAKQYLNLGCYLSINGIITFEKKNDDILKAIPKISYNRILLETDCPYLTPVPYRGKQNNPRYVKLIFNKLKALWDLSDNELKDQLKKNAISFFER